jgi:hypothetical protein
MKYHVLQLALKIFKCLGSDRETTVCLTLVNNRTEFYTVTQNSDKGSNRTVSTFGIY